MSVESAIADFQQKQDVYLNDLFDFLRFETISTQPDRAPSMKACAEWVRAQLESAGLKAQILSTGGHPAVYGDTGPVAAGNKVPVVLFYGHYDVQPIGDAALWESPAFEPTIRNGAVFVRGAADDKGPVMVHLAAMRSWTASGCGPPCRFKFLIEGEEEIGSPHLASVVREHCERLACDYVVLSDTMKHDAETPALAYSTRGLVYKEIEICGPNRDLHSGQYGGAVENPGNVLARIISSFHDDQHRVTIPGFYDDVLPLSEEERRRLAEHGISDAELKEQTGSPTAYGEVGYTTIERIGARPTLDVNGVWGGFAGPGSATIIPSKASAKISMRLVAQQDAEKVSQAFDQAVQGHCPPTVQLAIRTHANCSAYVAPIESAGMHAARSALEQGFGRSPVLRRDGGTLPILPLFKEVLGADSLMLGFSVPECNLHSPNEFFVLQDFEQGARCVLRFHSALAAGLT